MARRARRDLTLEEIVDRAVEIAEHRGEAGLTMSRVATACGVTPMALYHHVDDKEALLTHLVDRVIADAVEPATAGSGDWRTDLVEFLLRYRQAFLDHPTAAEVLLRRPVISANQARTTEMLFEAFVAAGFADGAVADAADAVVLLLFGSIAYDRTRPPDVRTALGDELPETDTPLLHTHLGDYDRHRGADDFRRAIDWLLDGMVASFSPGNPTG